MPNKLKFAGLLLLLLLSIQLAVTAAGTGTKDPRPTPIMSSVEPEKGQAGDVLKVSGTFLDKAFVAELYLTDGTSDVKAEIVEQSATVIRFKIPDGIKGGRYRLMVLTRDEPPMLLEEPFASLTVTESR